MANSSDSRLAHLHRAVAATVAAATLGSGAVTVVAQETSSSSSVLQEVVVTANKREQSVQDVGIAIQAFTGDQLEALGVEKSYDVAALTPGVHIGGSLAGQNSQFTIRGVTQNDFNDVVEAPVAVYLDEGYLALANAQTFAVFDIDRVEVLKGPQGTLFGRNATGGLVHYISRKPSFDKVEGYVNLNWGMFDSPDDPTQYSVEAAIGGPFSERFAARAAFKYNKQDPYLINEYPVGAVGGAPGPDAGADLGDDDTIAGRITFEFRPNDASSIALAFNTARSKVATGPYQQKPTIGVFDAGGELVDVIDVSPTETRASIASDGSDFGSDVGNTGVFGAPFGRPVPGGDFFGYIDPDGADFRFSSDFAFKNQGKVDVDGIGLRINWDASESTTLTSITDYKDYKKLLFIDVDAGPGNQLANYGRVKANSFTQELRLNGKHGDSNWVAGLFYLNIDTDSDNGLKIPPGSIVPGAPFDVAAVAKLKTDSVSLFGQYEWALSDRLTLITGGRLIREEKKYNFTQGLFFTPTSRDVQVGTPIVIGPTFPGGVPTPFADSTSDTLWAGKVQLEFRPHKDLLWYLGFNRGVKAGSFNAQLPGGLPTPASVIPYGAETLTSVESGIKWTSPSGRTHVNGSIYYYDYKDYQSFLFTGVSGVVINQDADNFGGELELQTTPVDGLDLGIGISAYDATVKDVPLRVGGPISRDVNPTYAPELQASGFARYSWPALNGTMAVRGKFQYSDKYYYNLRNFSADQYPSYTTLGAGINWTSASEAFDVGFSIENITDERVGIMGFDLATLCGCNEVSYRPPRTYGLSLRINF
ncbi:MAG: TonB-dependent receptor [Steroidobacteraceae bacterium]